MKIPELIYSTAANKCPRCHKGKVYKSNNPYNFKNPFEMKDSCSECGLKYVREPGFFYGALYVSYAITSGIFIVWFLADQLWFHMDAIKLVIAVASTMLILFPVAHRSSRIIWLNFFTRYDKKYSDAAKMNDHYKELDGKKLVN